MFKQPVGDFRLSAFRQVCIFKVEGKCSTYTILNDFLRETGIKDNQDIPINSNGMYFHNGVHYYFTYRGKDYTEEIYLELLLQM